MTPDFLSPPLELLSADGRFEPVGAGRAGWRRPVVLLARELCSFGWFDAGRAQGSAAAAAARLHARAAAPFAHAGWRMRRGDGGVSIWWWDRDWVDAKLRERFGSRAAAVAPETLAQAPGEGWRIIRSSRGFDAQCWRGGALIGSAWRPERFDSEAWDAFVRVQRAADEPAPAEPPTADHLPWSRDPLPGLAELGAITPAEAARIGAVAATAVLIAAGGFFAGQALRLGRLAGAAGAEATAVAAARGPAGDRQGAQRLAAFRRLSTGQDPLAALSVALGVLQLYDVEATQMKVDRASLTLTLPYAAIDRVDRIALELENSGAFADVRPLTDDDAQVIRLQMKLARPAPSTSP